MKTCTLSVVAAALGCLLVLAPARAAPADDAAATTTAPSPSAPPPSIPLGPIGQALEHLVKEGPDNVKALQDNFRKNAGALRERVRSGISRVVGVEATTKAHPYPHGTVPSTSATSATTVAPPPAPAASKPPTGMDAGDAATPTTPGNVPDATTLAPPDSRTLIGAPKRCGPNQKEDRNGRCREVYQDTD